MKIVFFVLLVFLAIIGVSHIIFEIYFRLTKLKDDNVYLILIADKADSIDLEFSVRSMISKAKVLNTSNNIICISDKSDEETSRMLSLLQKDYPYLKIMNKADFIKKSGL